MIRRSVSERPVCSRNTIAFSVPFLYGLDDERTSLVDFPGKVFVDCHGRR